MSDAEAPLDRRETLPLPEARATPPTSRSGGVPAEAAALAADPACRAGKYVKVRRVGSGGMGEVWRAWDTELGRWVALKFLKGQSPDEVARFRREAQTAAKLTHPNIAAVYEAQESCIAMQFVDGRTLQAVPRDDVRALVDIIRQAAAAVQYAHQQGVIHRDLKPGNIMVASGQVYVMDFGLAKSMSAGSTLSVSGMVMGTPSYMSPEQARGDARAVGPASDVYSLGATLYDLLAGHPPIEHTDIYVALQKVVDEEPPPVRRRNPRVDRDLETITMKCLEKEPARRYGSALELAEELKRWLDGDAILARPASMWGRVVKRARRNRAVAGSAALVLIVILAGGAWMGVQRWKGQQRLAAAEDLYLRRATALQRLSTQASAILDRKRELRQLKVPMERAWRDLAEAVRAVERHIAEWPDDPQGYYVRARGRTYLGDLEGAERDLRTALAKRPDFRPAWSLLGVVKVETCQRQTFALSPRAVEMAAPLRDALAAFERGWEAGREQEESERWGLPWTREDQVMERLAQAFRLTYSLKQVDAALRLLQDALAEYRAEEYAGWLGIWSHNVSERIRWLSLAIEWAPGYVGAYFDRGNVRLAQGDLEAAIADYDRAIELRSDFAEAYGNRGSAKQRRGDLAGALADYDASIAVREDRSIAYYNRGTVRQALGQIEGALADYSRAIDLQPDYAGAWNNRGIVKAVRGDLADALADFSRAIQLNDRFAEAYCNRAATKERIGDQTGVIEDFSRAIEIRPDYLDAYRGRGRARALAGDWEKAVVDWETALRMAPPQWPYRREMEEAIEQTRARVKKP